jgi:DNA-binding transcriptional LysR family regulator
VPRQPTGSICKACVGQCGNGISLVPETARKLHFEGAVLRELAGPPIFAQLFLVWLSENDNPALPAFRDLLLQHFAIPSSLGA